MGHWGEAWSHLASTQDPPQLFIYENSDLYDHSFITDFLNIFISSGTSSIYEYAKKIIKNYIVNICINEIKDAVLK